jgi:hypothetical protein
MSLDTLDKLRNKGVGGFYEIGLRHTVVWNDPNSITVTIEDPKKWMLAVLKYGIENLSGEVTVSD